MPSTSSPLGEALRPDGTLKDASEIVWSFDADDTLPFPQTSGDPSGGSAPAEAGLRRTTRISRPSRRYIEELDPECVSSSDAPTQPAAKRKAPSDDPDPDRRVSRKIVIRLDSNSDDDVTSVPPTEVGEDDYESIQAMADADNLAAVSRTREERTADVRLIFSRDKKYIHPATGKTLDGHWCKICRDDPSVKHTAFFTGGISTLRTHIARNHVHIYRKRCKAFGIEPNARALFRVRGEASMDK
jgi:hypothetical protein